MTGLFGVDFLIYLLIGAIIYAVRLIRTPSGMRPWDRRDLSNSFVLLKGGGRRPLTRRDELLEEVSEAGFIILFWPALVIFALFVPIHDFLARKAWERAKRNGELPWLKD